MLPLKRVAPLAPLPPGFGNGWVDWVMSLRKGWKGWSAAPLYFVGEFEVGRATNCCDASAAVPLNLSTVAMVSGVAWPKKKPTVTTAQRLQCKDQQQI
jgi:hypothetical protein